MVAPICSQFGQTMRVSMSLTTAAYRRSGRACKSVKAFVSRTGSLSMLRINCGLALRGAGYEKGGHTKREGCFYMRCS